jgi:hypothetical protein
MTRRRTRRAVLTVLAAVALSLTAGAHAGAGPARLTVAVDRTDVSTKLGQKFTFHATITNRGPTAAAGLIAHLNVLSLRNGTYVDPEDWSSHRTQYLKTIPAGGALTTKWQVEAVNHGAFGVYVAVLPDTGAARPPATGPTIHLAVAQKKTLNSGGVLPLALGIPSFLGFLIVGLRLRRGR